MHKGWTRWLRPMLLGIALSFGGCAWEDGPSDQSEERQGGQLRLSLVGAGQPNYRLRQATFDVTSIFSATSRVLSSDTEPEAAALVEELPQDSYAITLRDGWVLEHFDGATWGTAHGALVTQNPLNFDIRHGATTSLVYAFAIDGGAITFGEGSLGVTVDVVDGTTLASCDLLSPFSCNSGQTCLLADGSGKTFCAEPGPLPVGAACDSEQCVAGAQCLKLDPAHPNQGTCTRFCSPSAPPFNCDCKSLSFASTVGVCAPSDTPQVEYVHEFSGGVTQATCDEWNGFRSQLASGSYSSVVMNGSVDPMGVTCNDPVLATQICNDLASGTPSAVVCNGRTWNVGSCGIQNAAGDPATELSVDSGACACSYYSVRPCTDVPWGGANWGGVGTSSCWGFYPQTLRVSCLQ